MLPQGFHSTEKLLSINFLNSSVYKIAICVYWQYVLPKLPVQRFSFFVPGVPVGKKKAFNSFSCGPTTCQACFYFYHSFSPQILSETMGKCEARVWRRRKSTSIAFPMVWQFTRVFIRFTTKHGKSNWRLEKRDLFLWPEN